MHTSSPFVTRRTYETCFSSYSPNQQNRPVQMAQDPANERRLAMTTFRSFFCFWVSPFPRNHSKVTNQLIPKKPILATSGPVLEDVRQTISFFLQQRQVKGPMSFLMRNLSETTTVAGWCSLPISKVLDKVQTETILVEQNLSGHSRQIDSCFL